MKKYFTEWLDTELKQRGWSRADLARRAHVSQSTLSLIWSGERAPGPDFCRAVARALGYPQEYVFRKAGLLDDLPPPDHDPEIQLALRLLSSLPPEERQEALEYIQFKARKARRRQQSAFEFER